MGDITGIIIAIVFGVGGFLIGKYAVKYWGKKEDKKLLNNAYEVMEGTRENKTEIEGKNVDVNTFISGNINDAFVTVQLVADNLDLIKIVADEIDANGLSPFVYIKIESDALFVTKCSVYTF